MMPPFSTDKTSRVRFLDLDPLLPELRREGTLFMPESIRIERSGIYKFNDEPYIEKVVFGKYGCPETTSSFRTNMSRAVVNYDVDERLPDCAMVSPEHGVVMMNTNEGCGPSVLQGEEVYHFEWEPRCLMLVLAADNERQYLDEAMRAGRLLSDPFLVSVNFTVGLGPNPDAALVGTNCAHSRLMMKNYELDTTLHAEYRELKQVRDDLVTYNDLLKFWQHVLASRRKFLPPNPPPPPPPPAPGGPDGAPAPPAPPMQVTFEEQTQQFVDQIAVLEAREKELVELVSHCTMGSRAAGTTCGLPPDEVRNRPFQLLFRSAKAPVRCFLAGAGSVVGRRRHAVQRVLDALDARV